MTHFLSKLTIAGANLALEAEPDFDFYRLGRLLEVRITFAADDERFASVLLRAEYHGKRGEYELTMVCDGVRELAIPPVHQQLSLPELEIEECSSRGLEGVHFEVVSQFDRSFRCLCAGVSIHALVRQ